MNMCQLVVDERGSIVWIAGDEREERLDRRPIGRAAADVVEADNAVGIDEHVAAELGDVLAGTAEAAAAGHEFEIDEPGGRTVEVPGVASVHAVGGVEFAVAVDEDGPSEVGLANVGSRGGIGLEGNDADVDAKSFDFIFVATQLRQVLAAGQSAEMPMKDEQEPAVSVVREGVSFSRGIEKLKVDGGYAGAT